MKVAKRIAIILLAIIIIYLLGPKPSKPKFSAVLPNLPDTLEILEQHIKAEEATYRLKPDNEARIIWANDSIREKTDYAVLYLHGFSASQEEGDPAHQSFAAAFGFNLYLSRLAEHGIDTSEAMATLTADDLWNSAKKALAITQKLGKRVIVMGTSTGGTLALQLAATYPELVHALILLSPNIAINDPNAWILNNNWGLQIAQMVKGKYNVSSDTTTIYKQYWHHQYRIEAAVELEELLEQTMKRSLFEKIKQPTLLLYYYKDEDHQDDVVKVSAMLKMFKQLGTLPALKRETALPQTGDHVIGSYIKSKDYQSVIDQSVLFGKEVLGLSAAQTH